jgi:hypothetical protein
MRLYLGLVHYPVYNKNYHRIASAITTFDLHDIARVCKTYDIKKFFVITPLDDQRELVERVRMHWTEGFGANYNGNRKEAIELISVSPSLEHAVDSIAGLEGERPLLIATDANVQRTKAISYEDAKKILQEEKIVFLLFGTAWGLDKEVLVGADYILDPIEGRSGYQHLSVRAAAAIIVDRLAGREQQILTLN